ncbi:MAG TPA: DUF1501 domain-containing protein, partial [Solimonas sp.]|nr:DUF1501 domain-containing protein [Solimonas sp.]
MTRQYSRRELLRLTLGLGGLALSGCGGGGGGGDAGGDDGGNPGGGNGGGSGGISGYKALVCVFLNGGNDGYNMLVPTTAEMYARYSRARLNLAIPQDQLLPLRGLAPDGASYGLHPSCVELQNLFDSGSAALVSNVGSLLHPTTRNDFLNGNGIPSRLFSHNHQQEQWQTARPDIITATGWAGRISDLLPEVNGDGILPLNVSIAGSNLLQAALRRQAFVLTSGGASSLAIGEKTALRKAYDAIQALERSDPYESQFAGTHRNALEISAALRSRLSSTALATPFPEDNELAEQLRMVARLVQSRAALGMKRQIFFVSIGGWDN